MEETNGVYTFARIDRRQQQATFHIMDRRTKFSVDVALRLDMFRILDAFFSLLFCHKTSWMG